MDANANENASANVNAGEKPEAVPDEAACCPEGRTLLTEAVYRGQPSVVLESESVRVELLPGLGAKLVSLLHKPTGKEWLVDAGSRELRRPSDGSSFGEADMSGWDECFPTIDPCTIAYGTSMTKLPDHGDVWPRSWECRSSSGTVTCEIGGTVLPYRLTRKLRFLAADTLRMDYRVVNLGDSPLPFLWVPHPQFAVTEPTRIDVPPLETEALCVFGGRHHRAGESCRWDELIEVSERQNGDGRKYYAPGRWNEGWCGLTGQRSGCWLRMRVDPEQVPFFGVWIDEGMGNDRNAIALEPSIGYYDSLDRAVTNGTARIVQPGEAYAWSLELSLGDNSATDGSA